MRQAPSGASSSYTDCRLSQHVGNSFQQKLQGGADVERQLSERFYYDYRDSLRGVEERSH